MTRIPQQTPRLSAPELWTRVQGVLLPPSGDVPFAARVAQITGVPVDLAGAVELEYRRFLYLATLSDQPLAPPHLVHLAWELHSHDSGYSAFCLRVLGRSLVFRPMAAHVDPEAAYSAARTQYLLEFGAPLPEAIWANHLGPVTDEINVMQGMFGIFMGGLGAMMAPPPWTFAAYPIMALGAGHILFQMGRNYRTRGNAEAWEDVRGMGGDL